ncbi:hypothetical protein [Nostoc sp. CHAB 5715]|uniref:hypothetical protein n=1 Tax=Nostoc sp. CHAB 5715 TaxID=2780400 RepID=UPI001E5526C7|nr:hypothetical protein [Nostoc sp. CHAB 5715]MCC5625276.1 hypothetical protein [Nostoc sp. CHAB 5715]
MVEVKLLPFLTFTFSKCPNLCDYGYTTFPTGRCANVEASYAQRLQELALPYAIECREPPFGFTSRLRRETRLQRWIHRKALAPLRGFQKSNMSLIE